MDGTKAGTRKTLERLVGVCAKYGYSYGEHHSTERQSLVIVVDMLEELVYAKRGYDPELHRLYNMAREDLSQKISSDFRKQKNAVDGWKIREDDEA